MDKKGQALVKFVIILPIFLLLVLGVVDLGKIMYQRTMLEGAMSDVVSLYEAGKSEEEIIRDIDIEVSLDIEESDQAITFHLLKEVDIITPGLNLILDNPYQLDVSRSISYE